MREKNTLRPIMVAVARALAWVGLALFAYAGAGLIGGAIPANRQWHSPATGITIYLASNGIHTDLVVPKVAAGVDWRGLLRPDHLRDQRYGGYDYVGIGWGDAKFYRETPAWKDLRPVTVLTAAIGSDSTLVHVVHLPHPVPNEDVRAVTLRPEEYRRLAAFIRTTIDTTPEHAFGYGGYDAFYTARGRYSAIQTCNSWTGDALRYAGVRIGSWTPFPATVMWWF